MSSVTTASESGNQRKKTTNENLGWLASGSFLPRKRKPIENITQASLVFLEAEKAKLKSENAFSTPNATGTTAGGGTTETTTRMMMKMSR